LWFVGVAAGGGAGAAAGGAVGLWEQGDINIKHKTSNVLFVFFERPVFLLFGGGGLTQAKN
jgi:hypothetical protein